MVAFAVTKLNIYQGKKSRAKLKQYELKSNKNNMSKHISYMSAFGGPDTRNKQCLSRPRIHSIYPSLTTLRYKPQRSCEIRIFEKKNST